MIIIKKKFGFRNFAKHLQKAHGTPVKNQCSTITRRVIFGGQWSIALVSI